MTQIEPINITVQRLQTYLHQLDFRSKVLVVPSKDEKTVVVIAGEAHREKLARSLPSGTFNNYPTTCLFLPRLVK